MMVNLIQTKDNDNNIEINRFWTNVHQMYIHVTSAQSPQ